MAAIILASFSTWSLRRLLLHEFAFNLLFTAHLLAVNLAMAAPLVCIWLEHRQTRHADELAGKLGRRLAWYCCASAFLGVALGGLMLWWLWHFEHSTFELTFGILPPLRWWFLIGEIVFYLACMASYAALWNKLRKRGLWHRLLAVVAATNLIYHFPPLFVSLSVARNRPQMAGQPYNHQAFLKLWGDGEVLSRVVHHWLAAAAVAGVAVTILVICRVSSADAISSNRSLASSGAKLALVATALQVPVGLWVLIQLPGNSRIALLGQDAVAAGYFAVSILTALILLQTLGSIWLGETSRRQANTATVCLVLTVLLMVSALERISEQQITPNTTETADNPSTN